MFIVPLYAILQVASPPEKRSQIIAANNVINAGLTVLAVLGVTALLAAGIDVPGLIGALGNWLIDEACRQIRTWRDGGLRMRVAINLSGHQLRQPDLVDRIARALKERDVNPGLLTCEITESVAMEDAEGTIEIFKRLTQLGVSVSIDDFGTGHSSLAYFVGDGRCRPAHDELPPVLVQGNQAFRTGLTRGRHRRQTSFLECGR
jgi:hypothetical protein